MRGVYYERRLIHTLSADYISHIRTVLFDEAVEARLVDDGDALVMRKKTNGGKSVKQKHVSDIWQLVRSIRNKVRVPRTLLRNGKRSKRELCASQARHKASAVSLEFVPGIGEDAVGVGADVHSLDSQMSLQHQSTGGVGSVVQAAMGRDTFMSEEGVVVRMGMGHVEGRDTGLEDTVDTVGEGDVVGVGDVARRDTGVADVAGLGDVVGVVVEVGDVVGGVAQLASHSLQVNLEPLSTSESTFRSSVIGDISSLKSSIEGLKLEVQELKGKLNKTAANVILANYMCV